MKLSFIFLIFISFTLGFHPVKDFRVKDLEAPSKKLVKKNSIQKKDSLENVVGSATATVIATDTLLSSAPTIGLSEDIQMVFTDSTKSIYYLTAQIIHKENNYNETFQLLLDTGSSVTWVYNESCSSEACTQEEVTKFNDFSGLKVLTDFLLSYSGEVVTGDLISGNQNGIDFVFGDFEIANFTFGLASKVPDLFDGFNVSGILGIPSSVSKSTDRNLIYQLNKDNLISKKIFGLSLVSSNQTIKYIDDNSNSLDIPSNYGGIIVFGSKAIEEKSKFISSDSNLTFTDIVDNDDDYWLINLEDIKTSNGSSSQSFNSSNSNRKTIIDTGTTGFVLPLYDADSLHEQLFGDDLITDNKGNYAFPCDDSDQKFTFTIGGDEFEISASDFKGKEYTTEGLTGNCASMIQGLDSDQWVFGAAFLSKFYTVFDLEQGRVGFGDARITSYTLQEEEQEVKLGSSVTTTTLSYEAQATSSNSTKSNTKSNSKSDTDSDSDSSGAVMEYSGWTLLICLVLYIVL